MIKYAKLNVDIESYENLKSIQLKNKSVIQEHFIGSRKKLYSQGVMIATHSATTHLEIGDISIQQFNSFLGTFSKQLYKTLIENPSLFDLHIDFNHPSRAKNYELWEDLEPGNFFYNIDLNSAYWQVAYKLGYLNEKMYKTYIDLNEYKQVKRLCISFLARSNKKRYYLDDLEFEVVCDNKTLHQVYRNIRYYLYNIIYDAVCLTENWIDYNIDGVRVLAKDVNLIKDYFLENELKFKTTECRKIDEVNYLYGNKERKYKNR